VSASRTRPRLVVIDDPDAECPKIPRCALLDSPSDPHSLLDRLMGHAVTRLYLVANGATMRIDGPFPRRSRYVESDMPAADMTCHWLAVRYAAARSHRDRLHLIREAQEAHRAATKRPNPAKIPGSPEQRRAIAAAYDAVQSLRVVGEMFGVNKDTVRKAVRKVKNEVSAELAS